MRKISSVLTLILVVCLSIGGVSAAWVYAAGPIADVLKEIGASMGDMWDFTYTIRFVNNGEDLLDTPIKVEYGTEWKLSEHADVLAKAEEKIKTQAGFESYEVEYWMNVGSTKVTAIPADNRVDVVLYPSFADVFTAMFVDEYGHILNKTDGKSAWTLFPNTDNGYKSVRDMAASITAPSPSDSKAKFRYWEVRHTDTNGNTIATYPLNIVEDADSSTESDIYNKQLDKNTFKNTDISIFPVYTYAGAQLIRVDENGDGVPEKYQVGGFGTEGATDLVEIPETFNGKDVTEINANAFESYNDLHAVKIPATIEKIGSETFPGENSTSIFLPSNRETITLYFGGTPAQWATLMANSSSWDEGMGKGSRVFFIDNNDKVIDGYYLELNITGYGSREKCTWVVHQHSYSHTTKCTSCNNSGVGDVTNYMGSCGCQSCTEAGYTTRPDTKFWPATTPPDNYWADKIP